MALPATAAPGSDRARLAQLALGATLAVPDVVAIDAGPLGQHVTVSGGTVLRGVRVTADGGGRYSVDLGVHARMVALWPLADAIRERVGRTARLAGSDAQLGAVNITFHDVLEDAELVVPEATA